MKFLSIIYIFSFFILSTFSEEINYFTYDGMSLYNFIPIKTKYKNGEYGFNIITQKGKRLFLSDYDYISIFKNGIALAVDGTQWYTINMRGDASPLRVIPKGRWQFNEGLLPAFSSAARGTGFVNMSGDFVIPPIYRDASDFSFGLAPVRDEKTGLWGYINHRNQLLIQFRYKYARPFSLDGIASVCRNEDNMWTFIDIDGSEISQREEGYYALDSFSNGLCAALEIRGDSWVYIDTSGNHYFKGRFKSIQPFSEGLAAVSEDGKKYGFINMKGEMVIHPKYFIAEPFRGGQTAVSTVDSCGVIDQIIDVKGNILLDLKNINEKLKSEKHEDNSKKYLQTY